MQTKNILSFILILVGILIGLTVGGLLFPVKAKAQSITDYTASPPFISQNVPPNILLLLDNSGSMNSNAYDNPFDPATTYFGLYDPFECYDYASNKFIPDPAANPASPGTCSNGSYTWSGNLLNYATMRRIDIAKWVMMGGTCSVGGRDAQGGCRQLIGQSTFASTCCLNQTQSVPVAQASGRMPASLIPGSGDVYFHLVGSVGALQGAFCVDNDPTPDTSADCNDGSTYVETKWQIRVDRFENASGIIQQVGTRARFGLMEFKGAGDGGKVLSDVGSSIQAQITAIESTTPSTWTPLAESLYEATRYYAQIPPAYTSSDYSYTVTNRDPYYFTQPQWAGRSQYVNCCRSFVIIFTDGEPTQDQNIPVGLRDFAHGIHGNHCTTANPNDPCTPHKTNYPSNGSHYLDDVAYYAHITDLRQGSLPVINEAGKDLSGLQNLTIYTFFAFGNGSEILKAAAKAGGFEDLNGNNLPDGPEEWDRVNNYTGTTGGDGVPDTYFESDDADKLKDRLLAAITSILQRSSAGTSLSVLATSATGEGSLYQAFFYPSVYEGANQVKWIGYLQGLFLDSFGNVREDTDGDARLVLSQDNIIRSRYDTTTSEVRVDRYRDTDADGKADSATPFQTVGLRDTPGIWEAGKQLALKDASARRILTWVDADNDGRVDAGEQIEFSAANSATLSPYLRADVWPYTADNIVNFIRGEQVSTLRDRQITVSGALKVWKLGDPIHSTPVLVGAPKERLDVIYGDASYATFYQQYRNRRQVAYMGANDGMLHAFNAGFYHRGDDPTTTTVVEHGWYTRTPTDNSAGPLLGEEKWGFVPYELLPHLRWLAQPDYTHVYYVDLKPKVTDARIFTPDADHPNGWGTILIGGFRLGGSCGASNPGCQPGTGAPPMSVTADFGSGTETRVFYSAYFILDITNPEADPTLLWSFSTSDLGLTTSYPSVVRVNPSSDARPDNTNAKWYVVVGSGPTAYDGSSAQFAKMFALEMRKPWTANSNLTITTYSTSDNNAFMGDLITLDSDLDYRADALYAGDVIKTTGTPIWAGKLYRLTTASGNTDPAAWGVAAGINRAPSVVISSFSCSPSPCPGSLTVGPVVAGPTVTMDDSNKTWLFFGTGRYFSAEDKTSSETQYFIGVKDPVIRGSCTQTDSTNCERNNLLNVSSATVCIVCTGGTTQVSGVPGATSLLGSTSTTLQGLVQASDGWYTTLPASRERVVVSPTLVGGIVFFPSFVPTDDICSASGDGYLYALFYLTGSAYKESVIGTEASGSNTYVRRNMGLGVGLASQMAVHIGSQETDSTTGVTGRIKVCSQSSTGALTCVTANPPVSSWSRYISWNDMKT